MKEKCGMKKLIWVIEAYLVSFAFTVRFQRPELSSNFEETVDYLLAEAAHLLGEYSFLSVLLFILSLGFLKYMEKFEGSVRKGRFFSRRFFPFAYIWAEVFRILTAGIIALEVL